MVLLVTLLVGFLIGLIAGHRTSVLAAGFVFSFVVLFFIGVLDWFAYFFALTMGAFITSMLTR
jgi:hypothetical protein